MRTLTRIFSRTTSHPKPEQTTGCDWCADTLIPFPSVVDKYERSTLFPGNPHAGECPLCKSWHWKVR